MHSNAPVVVHRMRLRPRSNARWPSYCGRAWHASQGLGFSVLPKGYDFTSKAEDTSWTLGALVTEHPYVIFWEEEQAERGGGGPAETNRP